MINKFQYKNKVKTKQYLFDFLFKPTLLVKPKNKKNVLLNFKK